MKKLLFLCLFLLFSDILLLLYLNKISLDSKPYEYHFINDVFIAQIKDINIHSKDEFIFDNYFKTLSFSQKLYKYSFDEEYLKIILKNNYILNYKYNLLEPEIVEKIIYKENYVYQDNPSLDTSNISSNNKPLNEYCDSIENYFYVDNYFLTYPINYDLNSIRTDLINNLHTTYQTSIDYSELNTSESGTYSVIYISESDNIEIIVQID